MTESQWLHVFIDVPPDQAEVSGRFWSAALGWPLGEPWPDHPEFRDFEPPDGDPYVHQQIGDHQPRVHLDLEVADQASAAAPADRARRDPGRTAEKLDPVDLARGISLLRRDAP